ncbi:MAG: hypothetical protein AB1715_06015, partial [Acidobacteriota bacterium]
MRPGYRFLIASVFLAASAVPVPVRAKRESWPQNLFLQSRRMFYRLIKERVRGRPEQSQLNPEEIKKIETLEKIYPRLYGLLVNYFYRRDEPIFEALLETGTLEARREFERRYTRLVEFCSRTFVDCLFWPSPNGQYFRDIIPRFKGKDRVDIVVLSAANFANLAPP